MIRTIVIEDSELARIELVNLLSDQSEIEIIGQAENGKDAIALINSTNPDVLFIDIHLPDMNAFELLNEINSVPKLIFTTAYDEHAIKSFEYDTIDYLLKPIRKDRLVKAIEKIKLEKEEIKVLELSHSIFIKDSDNYYIAKLEDVELFHTEGNYTKVFYKDNSPLLHKALNHIERRLDPQFFFRVNRQQIVNINHVKKVDKWFKGKLKLTLTSGKEVEVSERQGVSLKQALSF